jgi:archaellum component FlaC
MPEDGYAQERLDTQEQHIEALYTTTRELQEAVGTVATEAANGLGAAQSQIDSLWAYVYSLEEQINQLKTNIYFNGGGIV